MFGRKRRKGKKAAAEVSAARAPGDSRAPAGGESGGGEPARGQGHESAGEPRPSPVEPCPSPGEPCPSPGEPGSNIGRYTIESTLGQGGMGRVHLARDPVIGRNVALKVISIRPDLSEEEAGQYRERFLREAQAAGALIHPNIVAVHDIGQDPASGSPYIVMEHVPGRDLKKVILSRAPLPPDEAVGIVVQIAQALDYAHRRGIVHRDIKPANVLITDQGRVKITDFGVARLPGSDLTRSDQFVGSPGFMSPEQLKGAPVDGRADLFSLGVILYELLTGKAPFEGETVSEVLYRISTQPAEPPSEAHSGVSPDFDRVLEKALSKDPEGRFQTGREMVDALVPLARGAVAAVPAADEGQAARAADSGSSVSEPAEESDPVVPSPWFTLTSQWRLAVLVGVLVLALVGVNWAISRLFRGPLGRAVQSQDEMGQPTGNGAGRSSSRGVSIAGASVPLPADRGARGAGGLRGDVQEARGGLQEARGGIEATRDGLDAARGGVDAARGALDDRAAAGDGAAGLPPVDRPIKAICAMTYAGPVEIGRAIESARHPRPGAVHASLPIDRPSGRIRVEVKHKMKAGRLLVLVDGKTVLSKPFEAVKGKSGTVTHVLSVPAGRHGVEVRLLADKGRIAAKSKIAGTVKRNEVALLRGEQPSASRKELELDWKVSH